MESFFKFYFACSAIALLIPAIVNIRGLTAFLQAFVRVWQSEMSEIVMAGRSTDPTDNLKKRPAKGILKTSSSFEVEDGPSVSRKDKPKNKGTKWDEMNIIETLHPLGKDYGHMKIEEPKTPYERSVLELEETDGVDADTLARKLEESSSKPLKSLARLEESDSEDDLTPEEKERKKAFESKRKAHYNEFLAAKKALKELKDEDDDEDEETVGSGGSPGADSASPKRK